MVLKKMETKERKEKCYLAKKASSSFICLACKVMHSFLKVSSWAFKWPLSISHSSFRCLCINSVQDSVWSATNLRISGSFPKSPLKAKSYDKPGVDILFFGYTNFFLLANFSMVLHWLLITLFRSLFCFFCRPSYSLMYFLAAFP